MSKFFLPSKPCVMGVLNVTPDSFSDGGQFLSVDRAVERALQMVAEGARIVDIGGESTGPGSVSVSFDEERARVMPVIEKLVPLLPKGVFLSIDTWKAAIAKEALSLGAHLVNDVTALRGDPAMASVVAQARCSVVLMYAKDATPRTTRDATQYTDVVKTIMAFLEERIGYAVQQGIDRSQIIIDPGMGAFVSGDPKYSFEILERLKEFQKLDCPILVGASRKSFLGGVVADRLQSGLDCARLAIQNGASIIRTHNVKETVAAFNL